MNIDWDDIKSCDYCETQFDCADIYPFIDSEGFAMKACESCMKKNEQTRNLQKSEYRLEKRGYTQIIWYGDNSIWVKENNFITLLSSGETRSTNKNEFIEHGIRLVGEGE